MATIQIKNVDALTLDEQGSIFKDTTLVVKDELILSIGDLPKGMIPDEVVDGHGRVAMPGLVNSHCHSPMTFVRGWAEDMLFPQWLQKVWLAENGLTAEDIYWSAALAAAEMIRSGTVAYNDVYFFMDRVADVARESGLKARLAWGVFGTGEGTEAGADLDETVRWIKEVQGRGESRIKTFLGPHSPYTCSPAFLRQVVEKAHQLGQGIHIHLAETKEQVQESLEKYGLTPVQQVDQLGIFDVPGGCVAAHTLWINERDTEILAEKKVFTPHCPNTYMKLAMRFPSLKERLEAGVQVCLGTDGPGSNADLDMFSSIRQTALAHKCLEEDPRMIPGDMALRMATQVGAKALGLEGSGVLKPGARADLILVNLDTPHMHPVHNLVANMVYSARAADVTDVMVDGHWLMRGRELITLDEERILHEAEQRAHALVQKVTS
jgi:5-methylthioadenosine/S-adenosylhomocysteine deaminase